MLLLDNALKYCEDVASGKEITTEEVKIQCAIFLEDYNVNQHKEEFEYYADEKKLLVINNLLKLFNFATGINVVGKSVLEALVNFQCFLLCGVFLFRFKSNPKKFKNNDITLFISRKNAKTFIVALIFILLMLTENKYSEFYSICVSKELAAEIRKAMVQILESSPIINKHFKVSKVATGKIECLLTKSFFHPRTAQSGKNNSVMPSAMVSDEHGNFQSKDNFNALKGGMKNVENPLVFRTTTAYAIDNSIMEEDIEYIKSVFEGATTDTRQFALLYYSPEEEKWDDIGMYKANPLRIEENYETIRDNRKKARIKASEVTEYLTKEMNIFIQALKGEKYIPFDIWKKCRLKKRNSDGSLPPRQTKVLDLKGKKVIVGVDASLTTDITAVTIEYKDGKDYYLYAHAFVPRGTLADRKEKTDYYSMERQGYCTITPGDIVDYTVMEEYILNIENKFGCTIEKIVSDPYNIVSSMQRVEKEGNYKVLMLKQNYTNLTPALKNMRDEIYLGNFYYEENALLDICVYGCVTTTPDKFGNFLLDKTDRNKSRIDLIVAGSFCHTQLFNKKKTQADIYAEEAEAKRKLKENNNE